MTDYAISDMIGPSGDTWNLPTGESKRQAIASLRGYAYQLHRTVSEWLVLSPRDFLFIEAAEDYSRIGRHPDQIDEVLAATQIKDTRQSGAVTLNSEDALAAIVNFWRLKQANQGRRVALTFLTTSLIGAERKNPFPSGLPGIAAWQAVARGEAGLIVELRAALQLRLVDQLELQHFLSISDDSAFVAELIKPITWSCGEPDYADIAQQNREDVIALGVEMKGSAEQSDRALDTLLHKVLEVIVSDKARRLTRGGLVEIIEKANTIRVPISRALASGIDLEATGSWVASESMLPNRLARRPDATSALDERFDQRRRLWLYGANGMGKSTLAALFGQHRTGRWQALRLRGMSGAAVSERLVAARQALGRMPSLIGLIIDDLPIAQESQYLLALEALGATLSRDGLSCVITANQQPGMALQQALSMSSLDTVEAPDFSDDDAAHLVAAYGGSPATWGKFVRYAGGFGHPQLVHAVVAGVAERGWQTAELTTWFKDGFLSEDVNKERAAVRRRLLDELDAEKAGLLTRLSRVRGSFDRKVVDGLASLEPATANARSMTEILTGTWVEQLGNSRLRVSPLIADLADHLAGSEQVIDMDRAIGKSIILRQSLEVDLLDTGFFHALMARDEPTIARLCFAIMNGPHSAALASAMPFFRDYKPNVAGSSFRLNSTMALLLAIGQHRLLVTRRDRDEINRSVIYTLELAATDVAHQAGDASSSRFMALMSILGHEDSMGLVDNWFSLLQQMDQASVSGEKYEEIHDDARSAMGIAPNDFLFVAHTLHLPNIEALQSLFIQLSSLPHEQRDRWLNALKHEKGWPAMAISNAWLKEMEGKSPDWSLGAERYAAMADTALSWGEYQLAARCVVAQSVLLDEYGDDPENALDVLAKAEAKIPHNLDLVRERAKIEWRKGNFENAFEGLSSIETWLKDGDAIEASFAFREAAISAGELERYEEAQRYFLMAHDAASKVKLDQEAFKLSLRIDAIGVRYMSGDRLGAIRALVPILEEVVLVDPETSLQNRAVALLTRHFVLWLNSQRDPNIIVDDRPVHYFVGAISNPSPHRGLLDMPAPTTQAPLWFLLGLTALEEGIGFDELTTWPGIIDLSRYADLYSQLLVKRVEIALKERNPSEFEKSLPMAMDAIAYLSIARYSELEMDPLNPLETGLDAFGVTAVGTAAAHEYLRDSAIAFALNAVLSQCSVDAVFLGRAVTRVSGLDLLPEWSGHPATDTRGAAATAVLALANRETHSLAENFEMQLRLWEWLRLTTFKSACMPNLSIYVRDFWSSALGVRRFEFSRPNLTSSDIEQALVNFEPTDRWLAALLLVARHATSVRLSSEFVQLLEDIKLG